MSKPYFFYQYLIMSVCVEYTRNGTESCYNNSVKKAIEFATKKGEKIVNDSKYSSCIARIKEDLHKYSNITLQTKRSTCVAPVLIEAEHKTEGKERDVYHDMNCFMSEIINNYDMIEKGEGEPLPDNFNEELVKLLGFGLDTSMFTTDEVKYPIKTSFTKRWSWYNQSVNFEHVCFVVACILTRKVDIPPKFGANVLYPFLYFIEKYEENKELLKFFMYHLIKLIRVYYTRSVDGSRFFNPKTYMTNMSYGSYMDPNVEIYGNVRISYKNEEALSMFSNSPRSTAEAPEPTIWFNWNQMTPIVENFTSERRSIWDIMFDKFKKQDPFTDTEELFKFLTIKDILPRATLAKHGYLNRYLRCVTEDEEIKDEEFIEAIKSVMIGCKATHNQRRGEYKNSKIGITYLKGTQIVSKVLNITFSEFMTKLNAEQHEAKDIKLVSYIVKCFINEHGHIVRSEYNNNNPEFEELVEQIETKQSDFVTI